MRKVILVICDGLGWREDQEHNAIFSAKTPNLDKYWKENPRALLASSGEAIGLPEGQMGTSEANHLVIGSGRVIYQNLVKINRASKSGELSFNPALVEAFEHVKTYNSVLHIKGIASPGGVHGHIDHIKALVLAAKKSGVKDIFLHLFTDGRDTAPRSALEYISDLETFLENEGAGKIASIGGRYYGMDRDNNRDRIEKHFRIMTSKEGPKYQSASAAIKEAYDKGLNDEFIEPGLVETGPGETACIQTNDAVIFANFRSDRAKQIAHEFLSAPIENLKYIAMTKYDDELDVRVAFPPEEIKNTLSEAIAGAGLKQLKITETEKFTHLTFFFNAQKYEAEKGEDRIMFDSDKSVATCDLKPEMRALDIASELKKKMTEGKYGFIATNLVNCDMVGHSGNFEAIIKGVEIVDTAIGIIADAAEKSGYDVIVTADHGNAEHTFDPISDQPITSHTTNPVPFILISNKYGGLKKAEGSLTDIAPTVLKILDIEIPLEMTGEPLV